MAGEVKETRQFATGATRDADHTKLAFSRFLSAFVLKRFAEYMNGKRTSNVPAGQTLREPDNWKKGIPLDAYMDSLFRHVFELWLYHTRGQAADMTPDQVEDTLMAIIFNVQGYAHEFLLGVRPKGEPRGRA